VRLLPRRDAAADQPDEPARAEIVADQVASGPKGRPTPKRRDADPRRGPVAAPKSRKEAAQRQRLQAKQTRATATPLTATQRRQRLLAGDPTVLPRRDAGPTRALARDYVDSKRMLSNWLLLLFPLIFISFLFKTPAVNLVILGLFIIVLLEWAYTGRKIIELAKSRGIDPGRERPIGIGLYAGTRAYLPRKWRVPRARVGLGDEI
jgi:Protein of unknown function (DUF3043)